MPTYSDYVDKVQQQYANPDTGELTVERYNISYTQYPSDLGSEDLKHFILFNINVRGKSKIDESKKLFKITDRGEAQLTRDQLASPGVQAAAVGAAAVASGTVVTALTDSVGRAFGKTGSTSKVVSKVAGIAGGGAVGAALAASDFVQPNNLYRITDAIALHVDGPPTVKYSMNYANKDLGTLMGVLSGAVFEGQSVAGGTADTLAGIGAMTAKLPGALGGTDVASALSAASGMALNPFKETVFESVDFRSFSFKYKFMPKNKRESESVYNIVQLFKEHMHPEISDENRLFFVYPSEFQITYYYETGPNSYFHKFRPCALESMDVTFGGEQFTSFKDGSPSEINLTLTFRELEILTRKMIKEGH